MKTIHVLSTAGWRLATRAAEYEMDALELMTMILAALEWRKRGQMFLYTDDMGEAFVRRHKFDSLYHSIVRLPAMPRINHQIFWDIYKTVALELAEGEAVIADTDLVVFKPTHGIGAPHWLYFGHPEPIEMQPYPLNREHFEKFGFSYNWNWSAPAVNTCLLWIPSKSLRAAYTRFSLAFAENYSAHLETQDRDRPAGWQFEPALFASQRMLGMVMDWLLIAEQEKRFLFTLGELPHHQPTPAAFHLWGRKEIYRTCIEPRVQFCNWLRDRITEHGTEAKAILEHNRLWRTFSVETEHYEIANNGRAVVDHDCDDNLFTRSVHCSYDAKWQAMDPCSGLTRTLRTMTADKLYRGDVLFTEKPGQCSVWWNKQKLADLEGPVAPGKADWIWNLPVNALGLDDVVAALKETPRE